MKKIVGAYAVLMTPFCGNKVDEQSFVRQVAKLNNTDVAGYVVNGSTSEFIHLSIAEQKRIIELVSKYKRDNKQMIVGACTSNIADTYEICSFAKRMGADACLVCPPYYFKYNVKEREEYFTKIADKSPLPIILYNIPFFTQELELDVIYRLFLHNNIIGIKDSSANMKRLEHLVEKAKGTDISVLTGTDDILYTALLGECDGSMTALATIFPEKICGIYDAVSKKDYERAKEINFSLMPMLRKADSSTFPRGYKQLLEDVSKIHFGDKEVL